jgi:alpha-D-ribose 1-methylphosphonate 5-triphosphate synthase subunit PhnL
MIPMIDIRNAEKTFVMHLQDGIRLPAPACCCVV